MAKTTNLLDKSRRNYEIITKILRNECLDDLQLTRSFKSRIRKNAQSYLLVENKLVLKACPEKHVLDSLESIRSMAKSLHEINHMGHYGTHFLMQKHIDNIGRVNFKAIAKSLSCNICMRLKKPSNMRISRLKMESFISGACMVMDRLAIDLKSYPTTINSNVHIMNIIECFSGYTFTYPLKTKFAHEISSVMKRFFLQHGHPNRILSDNGGEFKAQFIELLQSFNIRHARTSTSHPQTNGQCERNNSILDQAIRAILLERNLPYFMWDDVLVEATARINRRPVSVLEGLSPFNIFYGRDYDLDVVMDTVSYQDVKASDTFTDFLTSSTTAMDNIRARIKKQVFLLRQRNFKNMERRVLMKSKGAIDPEVAMRVIRKTAKIKSKLIKKHEEASNTFIILSLNSKHRTAYIENENTGKKTYESYDNLSKI